MSYIDALFDRDHDRIHIVGRRDGDRYYEEFAANYIFYYDDPRGKFRSIYGNPVSRFSTRNSKEFRKEMAIQKGKNLYEGDIKPNILKKAIRIAHKAEFGKEQQDHELLENILTTVGKTL